jgi:hypothetical protein
MPRKSNAAATGTNTKGSASKNDSTSATKTNTPACAGVIVSCDVPTVQYLKHLNETIYSNNMFILEHLDATHLLVKRKARNLILQKVEEWQSSNVFTSLDTGAENLDVS